MRDAHCGQCRKELEWEEKTPGYFAAACACGRKYSEVQLESDKPKRELRQKVPAWSSDRPRETHSWQQRERIDYDYDGFFDEAART